MSGQKSVHIRTSGCHYDHWGKIFYPVLFQLPPRRNVNLHRLRVYRLLSEKGDAFCIYDFSRHQSPKEVTAEFVYLRLHGSEGPYKGQYDSLSLSGWEEAISAWTQRGREVYCYFDNDQSGYAVQDAAKLNRMIAKG